MRLMYTQYKLLDLVEGKEKMPEAAELKGSWMKRSFDVYMLMVQAVGERQLDHIKDLLGDPECGPNAWRKLLDVPPTHATGIVILARRLRDIKFVDGDHDTAAGVVNMERSEEGAGYGVGGGKSGFKKKWKGKNKDNPKEDGGGGQGEVCFY
ncbi:unnamed protein product [Closterium sp. NIES-65]|nr:unnamed protein product [Closterium sp. NIES-65]